MTYTARDTTAYNIETGYNPPDNPYGVPLLGYTNVIASYSATTSATNHPASNMGVPNTYSTWQATSTAAQRIILTIGQAVDYLGIAAHNFNNDNTAIGLSYTSNLDAANGYLKTLLHFEAADATTVIVDSSGSGETWQVGGGNAQIDTAQFKFGTASCLFDGSGDFLQVSGDLYKFGTRDFTIDFWLRVNATGIAQTIIDARTTATQVAVDLRISATNHLEYFVNGSVRITGTATLATGAWHHVALARSGTSTKLFYDGTQDGSTYTDSNNYNAGGFFFAVMGTAFDGTAGLNGWLDEFRVLDGKADFTANFTPATAAYSDGLRAIYPWCSILFHFEGANGSTTVTDSGGEGHTWTIAGGSPHIDTAQFKVGSSSLAMTGAGKLQGDGGETFSFGLNDFTVDCWVRLSSTGLTQIIADWRHPDDGSVSAPVLYIGSDNKARYFVNSDRITGTTVLTTGVWYHLAICRHDQVTKLFVNGVQEGIDYTDNNFFVNGRTSPMIGDVFGSNGLNGWLDEFRVVKGTALFTRTFIAPIGTIAVATSPGGKISVDPQPVVYRLDSSVVRSYIVLDLHASRLETPSVAVLWAGSLVVFERSVKVDVQLTPMIYARKTNIVSGMSESGQFLGRILLSEWREAEAEFAWVTPTWYSNNIEFFVQVALESPFFWVWSPSEFPYQTSFAWLSDDLRPELDPVTRRYSFKISMRGIA